MLHVTRLIRWRYVHLKKKYPCALSAFWDLIYFEIARGTCAETSKQNQRSVLIQVSDQRHIFCDFSYLFFFQLFLDAVTANLNEIHKKLIVCDTVPFKIRLTFSVCEYCYSDYFSVKWNQEENEGPGPIEPHSLGDGTVPGTWGTRRYGGT